MAAENPNFIDTWILVQQGWLKIVAVLVNRHEMDGLVHNFWQLQALVVVDIHVENGSGRAVLAGSTYTGIAERYKRIFFC